jgi:hypothetical protein
MTLLIYTNDPLSAEILMHLHRDAVQELKSTKGLFDIRSSIKREMERMKIKQLDAAILRILPEEVQTLNFLQNVS